MGASDITNRLKKHDGITFRKISRNIVDGWIERPPNRRPHWKESVLCRVEHGNDPGHDKGGCRGILVCLFFLVK